MNYELESILRCHVYFHRKSSDLSGAEIGQFSLLDIDPPPSPGIRSWEPTLSLRLYNYIDQGRQSQQRGEWIILMWVSA